MIQTRNNKTGKNMYALTAASMLIAISVVFQIAHIGIQTQWGIWIDLVAIPWILAYFLFGFRIGGLTALISSGIIAIIAPSGMIGALMKLAATLPMIIVPAAILYILKLKLGDFEKPKIFLIALISAIIVRGAFMLPFNYYFAIPVYFGMPTAEAMAFLPPIILFGLNAIQGAIDFCIAWVLVFKYKLKRFQ